jgi:Spy/CpxP family protein refolding chaperone
MAFEVLSFLVIPITYMISLSQFVAPAGRLVRRGLFLGVAPLVVVCAVASSLRAQDASPPPANANTGDQGNGRRNRGNFSPEAMMDRIKTMLDVTDEAWTVIQPRIQAVMDLRLATAGGGFGGGLRRGGGGGGGGSGGFQRGAPNPEVDALRQALTDNMPDAEIKVRLDHLREVRKDNEAKLEKARVDLQAVLTPKQEAMAVVLGLLN